MITKLRRLFEQDMDNMGDMDNMEKESSFSEALPMPGESTVPMDAMSMTVRDFLAKCKQVDPLVCMGIEAFIEKNSQEFGEDQEMPSSFEEEPDLNFSNAIEKRDDSFSLDSLPSDLTFPNK